MGRLALTLEWIRYNQRQGTGIVSIEARHRESGRGESPMPAQVPNGPGSRAPNHHVMQ